MPSPSRPLTTRELLDQAARIYAQNFFLFVGISAIPYLCCLAVNLSFSAGLDKASTVIANWAFTMINALVWVHRRYPSIPLGVLTVTLQASVLLITTLFGIIPLLFKFLSGAIITAASSIGVTSIYSGQETSVSGCYARLKGKFGKILYVFVAVLLRTLAGLVLFILPGIYWGAKDSLAMSALALEEIKGKQARARSAALTKGSIKRILIIYFVFAVLEYEFKILLAVILSFCPIPVKMATWIFATLVLILTTPFIAIALTLAYYDQRVRLEAFKVEAMMSDGQQVSSIPSMV